MCARHFLKFFYLRHLFQHKTLQTSKNAWVKNKGQIQICWTLRIHFICWVLYIYCVDLIIFSLVVIYVFLFGFIRILDARHCVLWNHSRSSVCLSVCPSVRLSLNFLKIRSIISFLQILHMTIADHNIYRDWRSQILKKKLAARIWVQRT